MSDDIRRIRLPVDLDTVRSLRAGEMVLLSGDIILTAGLPTHRRIEEYLDAGQELPLDLRGQTLFHLGSYSRDAADGAMEVLYINPTTSTRFNHYMPRFIREFGLRLVGGKGGLDAASAAAMKQAGCAYLSFAGGASPLLSDAVKQVVSVHWPDLIAHFRLVCLRVEDLGPLTVGIDAHGNSLYDDVSRQAADRLPEIMAGLATRRMEAS